MNSSSSVSKVYPRVGGGNAGSIPPFTYKRGLSPRGRGKLIQPTPAALDRGSIPAWAGETFGIGVLIGRRMVYPRVGGGNDDK